MSLSHAAGALFGLALLVLLTAFATLISSGAPGLAVWLIVLVFGVLSVAVILSLPMAGENVHAKAIALLCIFVFFLVFWPKYAFVRIPGFPGISPTRISQVLLMGIWFYLIARSTAHRETLFSRVYEFRLILSLLGVFLSVKFVGIFLSDAPFSSGRGFFNELISVYLVLIIALTLVRSHSDLRKVLASLIVATVFVCFVGAYEIFSGQNVFLPLFEIDSKYLFDVMRDKTRYGTTRIQATFNHPLTLSEYMAMVVPLIAVFWLQHPRSYWRSIALAILAIAAGVMVVRSGSRSGLGAFMMTSSLTVVFLLATLAVRAKDVVRASLVGLFVILGLFISLTAFFAFSELLIGRTSREIASAISRIDMWRAGLPLAFDRPILGYGQDMAAETLGYRGSYGTLTIDSYYLSVLLDAGFFALILYALFLLTVIGSGIRNSFYRGANAGATLLISLSLMAFAAMKIVLSLPHNHGLVMLFVAMLLFLIHEDRLAVVNARKVIRRSLA